LHFKIHHITYRAAGSLHYAGRERQGLQVIMAYKIAEKGAWCAPALTYFTCFKSLFKERPMTVHVYRRCTWHGSGTRTHREQPIIGLNSDLTTSRLCIGVPLGFFGYTSVYSPVEIKPKKKQKRTYRIFKKTEIWTGQRNTLFYICRCCCCPLCKSVYPGSPHTHTAVAAAGATRQTQLFPSHFTSTRASLFFFSFLIHAE
jgi:hypothetical protein